MEERTYQQPGRRQGGSRHGTLRSRTFRRTRAVTLVVCAAALALAVGVGVHSAVQARLAPASQLATQTGTEAPAPAAQAGGAVDAELDAQINSILDANSEYQIGVALVDL
ncbi:MAG: hypothetical protein ABWX85_03140, partial [Arthrobacter sp.]